MADKSQARASALISKRIKPVEKASPYLKMLVYGRNKNGKTRFASTGPKVLIIDVNEEGSRSAVAGSHVVEVRKFDEAVHVYWYLKAGNHPFKTVAIDTVSALQNAAIRKVLGDQEDRDPSRESSMPDRRTWGRANELMKGLMMDFRNLPMHVIFLAQERVIAEEDSDEPALHTVDLPPGSRGTALGCVGVIGRIYLREVKVRDKRTKKVKTKWEARMLVGPHEQYDTGGRVLEMDPIIRNPTVPQFIEAWQNRGDDEEE